MDKENVTCIYTGILFGHKKESNLAICDSIYGPWGHCTK